MWYVYFLELSNTEIYVGFSTNLRRRMNYHSSGKVTSTAKFLPIKLRCYMAVDTKEKAVDLERYFKSGSGKAILIKRFL